MTRTGTTKWLLRAADLAALAALLASLAITSNNLSSGGSGDQVASTSTPTPFPGATAGDRDGDGVPDSRDLAPDTPAPASSSSDVKPFTREPVNGDCERKGITRERGREGVCMEDSGRSVHVVNRASPLRLDELSAQILDMRPTDNPKDRFARVAFELEIGNRLDTTVSVQPAQFQLLLGRRAYLPDLLAAGRGANSMFRRGAELKAGRTVKGSITFTITHKGARRISRDGNLELLQFSDTALDTAALPVGVFRTYR